MYMYLWAVARGVDLQDRFESAALFSLTEVADLDTYCGRYLEEVIAELPRQAPHEIGLEARNRNARVHRRTINLVEKWNRLTAIYSFIEYTSADHLSRLHLWPNRWSHDNSVRDNCLQWIKARYKAIKKPSNNDVSARKGRDKKEIIRLRTVIEPDHVENPIELRVRSRNYLIVRLLLDLGHVDKWRSQRRIEVMSMKARKLSAVLS